MTIPRAPRLATVRIDAEVLDAYRRRAREEGRKLSGLIELVLRKHLHNYAVFIRRKKT